MVSLSYVYNAEVYWATKLTPFSLVLSHTPPGSATPMSSPMPLDFEHVHAAIELRISLINWAGKLKSLNDSILR